MRLVSAVRASIVAAMVGGILAAVPTPASALYSRSSLQVDVGLFYDDLSPHGDWIEDASYGWVWAPRVSAGWRPYTEGRWVWTDEYGWLWVSYEQFGWATYHYGRWYYDPGYGWAWVPGYDWGPSWCSFRYGGGYVGWAPLPPRVPWQVGLGFQVGGVNIDAFIQPNYYTFVPAHAFVDSSPGRYAVPVARNTTIINVTKNITNYTTVQNRVVNRSLRVDEVEKVAKRSVTRVKAVDVTTVGAARNAKVKDNEVPVFRPQVREAKTKVPPRGKPLAKREATSGKPPQTNERDDRSRTAEVEKQRATDQREAHEKRAAEAKREAESRQQLEKQRQDDQRAAEKRREDATKREAEARRQLEKRRASEQQERERMAARQHEDNERQREQLEKRQAHERTELEREHRKEIKTPARADVDRTQERERAAMEERQYREKQQLQSRQAPSQQVREAPKQREKGKPKPKATPSSKPNDRS